MSIINAQANSKKRRLCFLSGFVAILGLTGLIYFFFLMQQEDKAGAPTVKKPLVASTDIVITPEESFRIKAREEIKAQGEMIQQLKSSLEDLQQALQQQKERPFFEEETPLPQEEKINPLKEEGFDLFPEVVKKEPQRLAVFETTLPKKEETEYISIDSFVPAGTFVKVSLLSGVDASCGVTDTADPRPVLLRLNDDGNMPRAFKGDLKDCRILGAATGDLSSERVYIRARTLTCIERETEEVLEIPIQGYVTGGDGKVGIRGEVVSRAAEFLEYGFLSGMISGLSNVLTPLSQMASSPMQALSQPVGSGPSNKDRLKMAAGSGAENALNRLSQYYIDRAEQVQPVIQIAAGIKGELIVQEGFYVDKTHYRRQQAIENDQVRVKKQEEPFWTPPQQERTPHA